jgi:hypothetical protein
MRQDITSERFHKRVSSSTVTATPVSRILKAELMLRQVLSDRLVSDTRLRMRLRLTVALYSEPTVFGVCSAPMQPQDPNTNYSFQKTMSMVRCAAPTRLRSSIDMRTADIYIDNTHVELSLWDTAGQEEFDRLRSLSYDDTHAIMLCFSVDSPDSLENVETKWVGEIAENCPGVKLVLVALKCDLRKKEDDDAEPGEPEKPCIDYNEGLRVAEKIKALRYLGTIGLTTNLGCHANGSNRMFCHEESGRQRSLHRSRPSRATSQDQQGQERRLHNPMNWTPCLHAPFQHIVIPPRTFTHPQVTASEH